MERVKHRASHAGHATHRLIGVGIRAVPSGDAHRQRSASKLKLEQANGTQTAAKEDKNRTRNGFEGDLLCVIHCVLSPSNVWRWCDRLDTAEMTLSCRAQPSDTGRYIILRHAQQIPPSKLARNPCDLRIVCMPPVT